MYTVNLFTSSTSRCHLFKMTTIVSVLLAGSIPLPAMAETAAAAIQSYNIPAQPLDNALTELADDANLKLLYQADVVNSLKSQPLSGRYTPQQALEIMLQGTGLKSRTTDHGGITIEKDTDSKTPTSQKPDPNTVTLKPTTVSAERRYAPTDPYNPDYVLPNATAGTKTDTPIMETPLNIQVVSKQVMKDQQVITLGDALKNVSGVTASNGGTYSGARGGLDQRFILRGFESQTFFRNGFRLQEGSASKGMANVESVEVLKGSAAVLYGLVEPGGMVNVITKQPLATPYYAFNQQFGSYDHYRTTLDATGPIAQNKDLLYRVNMSYQNSGSFREFVGKEDVFFAPVLKWIISPKTQASFELEYNHQHLGLDNTFVPLANGNGTLLNTPRSRNYGEYASGEVETVYGGFNWSHQFNDDWSIKQRFSVNQRNDSQPYFVYPNQADATTVSRFPLSDQIQSNTYSTNLDLVGHFETVGLKHTLLFGGDYYRFDTANDFRAGFSNPQAFEFEYSTIDLNNPIHPGTPLSSSLIPYVYQATLGDQYGLYIQDQIKLPFNIQVMGGIRYQYLHQKSLTQFGDSFGFPASEGKQADDAVTPRVGFLWQPKSWLSLYANYVESFSPNTPGAILVSGNPAPPSGAEQYEGGIKTEFFDGRLRATLAYYDLTKTDIATPKIGDPLGRYILTGAVRSRGPEVDISGELLPGWNMIATYTNTDARVVKSNDALQPVGSRFWNVPSNMGSLWSTYEIQGGDLKGLKFGGGVTLREGSNSCCDLPAFKTTGYASVDLLAAYTRTVGKAKVTAQLNINNLLDKNYWTAGTTGLSVNQLYVDFGQPRTFMGSINIQY